MCANTNKLQTVANPSTTRTVTHNASGELLTDDRGIGQTFDFVHDGERRLKSVSANASLIATYGHDGLRNWGQSGIRTIRAGGASVLRPLTLTAPIGPAHGLTVV